jgi:hypothetical protein
MGTERIKLYWRGLNPDEQINAALGKELPKDRSEINTNPVYRKLYEKTSQPQYNKIWEFLLAYFGNIAKPRLV